MPQDTALVLLLSWSVVVCATADTQNADINTDLVFKSNSSGTWYGAEVACRRSRQGHLLSLTSHLAEGLLNGFTHEDTDMTYWVGARKMPGGTWKWADGSEFYMTTFMTDRFTNGSVFSRTTFMNTHSSVSNTAPSEEAPSCMYIEWQDEAVLKAGPCDVQRGYLCSISAGLDCAWSHLDLTIPDGYIKGRAAPINISPLGIVSKDGVEMGIGEWETSSRISVLLSEDCRWRAVFYVDKFKTPMVMTGCEGSELTVGRLESSCRPPREVQFGRNEVKTPSPEVTPTPTNAPPSSTNAPPDVTVVDEKEGSGIPMWVWPLAFTSVALVSAMMAVGAARRRGRSPKEKQVENVEMKNKPEPKQRCDPSAEMDHDTAACAICQKFCQDSAKERLVGVHMALQKQFCAPFNVVSTRCHHVGNEHVHVFSVENDLDAPSLGALSTIYSRTKPRLPKNTRIHIEHCKPTPSLDDESDEEAPKPVDPQEEDQQYSESEGGLETGYDVDTLRYHFD